MEGEDADALKKARRARHRAEPPRGRVALQGGRPTAGRRRRTVRPLRRRRRVGAGAAASPPTTWSTRSTRSRSNGPTIRGPAHEAGPPQRQEQQRMNRRPAKAPAKSGRRPLRQSGRTRGPTQGGARVHGTQRRLVLEQWRQTRHGEGKAAPRPRAGQADRGVGAEGRRDHRARHRQGEAAAGGGRRGGLRARARERPARAAGGEGGRQGAGRQVVRHRGQARRHEYLIVKEDEILGIRRADSGGTEETTWRKTSFTARTRAARSSRA